MGAPEQNISVDHAGLKITTAWVATAFTSWAEFAAFLAAIYTMCLLGEWLWRKILRPFAERHGWVKRLKRRSSDWRPDEE